VTAALTTRPTQRRWRDGRVLLLRAGPVSARVDGRALFVSLVTLGLILVVVAWSVTVGDFPIPLGDVVAELSGAGGSSDSELIIRTLRLPRVVTGALVGAAFGVSGQVFQRLVRNPLASPDILGVSAGAAVGAVSCIVLIDSLWIGIGPLTVRPTPTVGALVGSILTVGAIYLLAIKKGLSSYRLVLIGIGITAMLDATIAYLLTRAELYQAQQATVWLTGSLNGRSWDDARALTISLAVLIPVILFAGRQLRVMEMGDDAAAGLGVSLHRSKAILALSAAALAAVATAAAGPVGFVALVAPQIARRLIGGRSAGLIPSALVGAAILVTADLIARRAFAPTELPVGVVTAVVGAPYLLWLLARANRIGSGG
jgi:iron complex transport system permease protein